MITAKFAGGPLDGQECKLPGPFLNVEISEALTRERRAIEITGDIPDPQSMTLYINGEADGPRTRYTLHHTDEHGVAHYYVPTNSEKAGRP